MKTNYFFVFDATTYNMVAEFDSEEKFNKWREVNPGSYSIVFCNEDTDNLQTMLTMQNMFQRRLGAAYDTQYIMNHILYAEAEMHEFLRELEGFKAWKIYDWSEEEKAEHLANAKEEFIDVLHFICNVALALGLTSSEIMEIYAKKNIENHARQDRGY